MSAAIFFINGGLNVLGGSGIALIPAGLRADDDDFILENQIYRRSLWMSGYSDDNHLLAMRIFA